MSDEASAWVVIKVPEVIPVVTNAEAILPDIVNAIAEKVKKRTRAGVGADGPLPAGKTGHPPLQATGTLVDAIAGVVKRTKRGELGIYKGQVFSQGKRADASTVKLGAAEHKTKQLRTALDLLFAGRKHVGREEGERFRAEQGRGIRWNPKAGETGAFVANRRTARFRTVETNAGLAGILSVKPKDPRARKGNRGTYRVFEPTPGEVLEIRDYMLQHARVEFLGTGRFKVSKSKGAP